MKNNPVKIIIFIFLEIIFVAAFVGIEVHLFEWRHSGTYRWTNLSRLSIFVFFIGYIVYIWRVKIIQKKAARLIYCIAVSAVTSIVSFYLLVPTIIYGQRIETINGNKYVVEDFPGKKVYEYKNPFYFDIRDKVYSTEDAF